VTATTEIPQAEDAAPVAAMWARRDQFAAVLPKSLDVEAFLGTAAAALYADEKRPGQKTPTLMEAAAAHPVSLVVTLMKCAALGHMPGTDEFYLHVRKGKVTGTEGYRGIVERMYRSGAIRKVVVREVCARDRFRFIEGVDDRPVHITGGDGGTGAAFFGATGSRQRGAMVGVYAYAEFTAGGMSRVVLLDRDDVMAARDASDSKDSDFSPWNRLDAGPDHPELTGRSMWWKTAAKRLEPWVPTSAEYRREQLRATAAAGALPNGTRAALDRADIPPEDAPAPPQDDDGIPAEDRPGTVSTELLTQINIILGRIGFTGADRDAKLYAAEQLAGRAPLSGPHGQRTSKNLSWNEAVKVRDTLDAFDGDKDNLLAWITERQEVHGDDQ